MIWDSPWRVRLAGTACSTAVHSGCRICIVLHGVIKLGIKELGTHHGRFWNAKLGGQLSHKLACDLHVIAALLSSL
jgi:hypothetical protein